MSEVFSDVGVTMDGYASGRGQTLEKPFGDLDADKLHAWMFDEQYGAESAAEVAAIVDAGAFIMGRNMFAPTAATGTSAGRAGGARTRRTTDRSSCWRTATASPSRWTAARRSTS